jgi:hypothetical protein
MSQEVEEDGFRVTRAMGVYVGRDLELYVVNPFYDPRLTVRARSSSPLRQLPCRAANPAIHRPPPVVFSAPVGSVAAPATSSVMGGQIPRAASGCL